MRDLVFLFIWLMLWPLSFFYAHIGVLIWIWVALLAPNAYMYGFMSSVPFNKLVASSTVLAVFVGSGVRRMYLDGILLLLALFLLQMTCSYFLELVPTALSDDLYDKMAKIVVFAVIFCFVMDSRVRLHASLIATSLAVAFVALWEGALLILTAGGHQFEGRSAFGDNNQVAVALLMLLPVLIYLRRWSASRLARLCFGIVAVFDIFALVASNSRGGFLGLLIVGCFYLWGSKRRAIAVIGLLVTAFLVYSVAPSGWTDRISTISNAEEDSSFMGRVVAWKISTLIALDNPIFGGGPHAVQIPAVWSEYALKFDLLDFVQSPPPTLYPRAAHSIWFEVLGDLGFVGLFLFVLIVVLTLTSCRSTASRARGHQDLEWARDLARTLTISVSAYLIAGSAVSMAYSEIFFIFVAFVSRLGRTVREVEHGRVKPVGLAKSVDRIHAPVKLSTG